MIRFENHVVNECFPDRSETGLWFPFRLLSYLSVFIVNVEPPPFRVKFRVSTNFVKLDLLFMIAALQKSVKFFATFAFAPYALLRWAHFKSFPCLPALPSCNLVSFQLMSVFFYSSEDVQSPVIPHRWPSLDHVVRLREESRQVLNCTVCFLRLSISLQVFFLLTQHRRCEVFFALVGLETWVLNHIVWCCRFTWIE